MFVRAPCYREFRLHPRLQVHFLSPGIAQFDTNLAAKTVIHYQLFGGSILELGASICPISQTRQKRFSGPLTEHLLLRHGEAP
jgi:hypothetical protein